MAETIIRMYAAEFDAKPRRRQIEGRAVPFAVRQEVSDDGGRTSYFEQWHRGAFDAQAAQQSNVGRVRFTYNHEADLKAWIGRTVDLDPQEDGLYGVWQVDDTDYGEIALYKAQSGQLRGLSIGANPLDDRTLADGTVERVRAWLGHVALCELPAFPDAQVLAVRKQQVDHRNAAADRLAELRQRRDNLLK